MFESKTVIATKLANVPAPVHASLFMVDSFSGEAKATVVKLTMGVPYGQVVPLTKEKASHCSHTLFSKGSSRPWMGPL